MGLEPTTKKLLKIKGLQDVAAKCAVICVTPSRDTQTQTLPAFIINDGHSERRLSFEALQSKLGSRRCATGIYAGLNCLATFHEFVEFWLM